MHFMCYFSISLILVCCVLKVSPSSSASRLNDEERFKRRKRESVLDYYIDITAYVDYTAYSRFLNHAFLDQGLALKNIKDYYGFIIDGVDKIYRDSVRNKFNLHVKLSQVVVFKDPEMFPLTYISTSSNKLEPIEVQTNFTEFLLRNDLTKGTNPYDLAILFIEADLWINNREVKGISYFGSVCSDDGTSSSVVEDMGDYYCIYTTAKALAVSMSARIDGDYNNCSSEDFYLMSNQLSNITDSSVLNPWRLSNCTIESIVMFISSLENTSSSRHACLLNTTVTHVSDVSPRLLGQEIYPDKQCQLKYGQTSYDCQRKNMTSNICTHMFCFDPNRSTCLRQLPLHGTTCSCGKICNQGACVDDQIFQNIDCGVTNAWSNCTLDSCLNKAGGSELCPHTCITYVTYLAYLASKSYLMAKSNQAGQNPATFSFSLINIKDSWNSFKITNPVEMYLAFSYRKL
ncbi:ADAM family mig-17-like isoform X1 [Biomphalaria pfeifferi]|uniref:ADAM family mig-17-like isoform X1 n=1 Tax=Biomphalaria pfeifferi TaxID=112525 RepID=A0AAD8BUI3_BIOPF|nr:ADAM family mig-17-like isoform X1 [Biomphalaria pfeifferi]